MGVEIATRQNRRAPSLVWIANTAKPKDWALGGSETTTEGQVAVSEHGVGSWYVLSYVAGGLKPRSFLCLSFVLLCCAFLFGGTEIEENREHYYGAGGFKPESRLAIWLGVSIGNNGALPLR